MKMQEDRSHHSPGLGLSVLLGLVFGLLGSDFARWDDWWTQDPLTVRS